MMKRNIFLLLSLCSFQYLYSQQRLNAIIKDAATHQALAGASVLLNGTPRATVSDRKGVIQINNIPDGIQTLRFSYTGYEEKKGSFNFPLPEEDTVEVFLTGIHDELTEVIIQSTRTSRSFANTPTRVETIAGEELAEKNNMRPANVSMLLHESTGLLVQQTSATSGSANIRVQGLDGRYTQLLKDGYPNFGNFASGLSILEIPPLDLLQVELIKGPASTLYGGGAIGGVVNFISKIPRDKADYSFMINHSGVGQTNLGAYLSQKKGRYGYALLATLNRQKAYDADSDGFSELPQSRNFTIHPRLFYYPDSRTTLMLGNSFTRSSIRGGDMQAIGGHTDSIHVYFEDNHTVRNTTNFEAERKYKNNGSIKFRQSFSIFSRQIRVPGYYFSGLATNSFTDLSWLFIKAHHTIITGINFLSDRFRQKTMPANQDTKSFTAGIYTQDTWDLTETIKIESGIRLDNVDYSNINYKKQPFFLLPRISVLFKISNKLSSRIGAGMGYKIPSIFTEQTEAMQYRNLLPLNNTSAETSAGATADINYKTYISESVFFSVNQLFFHTQINRPLVLQTNTGPDVFFANAVEPVQSSGFETNLRIVYKGTLKLLAGYTFTRARARYLTGNQALALVPKNKLNGSLVYEKEENFKIGLEAYFTGRQYLYNGTNTPSFWELGAMAEKSIGKISLFINFENFTDERQGKYKPVVNPPYINPSFDDIWNHTEGFIINGGLKIKL
ncbi:MAG: TonB-dependent receptor [Bacteroidota bacterium]